MYNLIINQSTSFSSIVHDVSNTNKSRSHFTSCLLELVIPYKCVYYLIKPESCGFTCCERSSVSDAHMVYETLNSCNVNSVFTVIIILVER